MVQRAGRPVQGAGHQRGDGAGDARVHPEVVTAMHEVGISLDGITPQKVTGELVSALVDPGDDGMRGSMPRRAWPASHGLAARGSERQAARPSACDPRRGEGSRQGAPRRRRMAEGLTAGDLLGRRVAPVCVTWTQVIRISLRPPCGPSDDGRCHEASSFAPGARWSPSPFCSGSARPERGTSTARRLGCRPAIPAPTRGRGSRRVRCLRSIAPGSTAARS